MTLEEFRAALAEGDDEALVRRCLDPACVPYVFDAVSESWHTFRTEVAAALGTRPENLRIVGSGLFGFSMKPSNNFRSFRDTSDIDVVVVDADLFDGIWINLLKAAYPRPPVQVVGRLKDRQKALYTGWILPSEMHFDLRIEGEKVRPALEFKSLWFDTFKRAAAHVPRAHEDISARLYRTWEHVYLYHLHGLRALRDELEQLE